MDLSGHPVLIVMTIAVASALLAQIRIGPFRLPIVVLEMIFGIIVGPQVLGLANPGGLMGWLGGTLGLSALFFMAGFDLDLELFRGRPLSLAVRSWALSFALGLFASGLLYLLGVTRAPILLATMLATTALGTLLPILRDGGELGPILGASSSPRVRWASSVPSSWFRCFLRANPAIGSRPDSCSPSWRSRCRQQSLL